MAPLRTDIVHWLRFMQLAPRAGLLKVMAALQRCNVNTLLILLSRSMVRWGRQPSWLGITPTPYTSSTTADKSGTPCLSVGCDPPNPAATRCSRTIPVLQRQPRRSRCEIDVCRHTARQALYTKKNEVHPCTDSAMYGHIPLSVLLRAKIKFILYASCV